MLIILGDLNYVNLEEEFTVFPEYLLFILEILFYNFGQRVAICESGPMLTFHCISAFRGKYKKIYVIVVSEAYIQSKPKRGL